MPDAAAAGQLPFFTIGHSTRPWDTFVTALRSAEIDVLADVRTVPRSQRNPHFDRDYLSEHLPRANIAYRHIPALGGLRKRQAGVDRAINAGWENESFHNYADYALGAEFGSALQDLIRVGGDARVAIMCAEARWWQCHRRIVCDHLLARGETVFHIMEAGRIEPAEAGRIEPAQMNPAARSRPDGAVTYPGEHQPDLFGG